MALTAAFFDLDGTLTRSDIVRDHLRFRRDTRRGLPHALWMAWAPARVAQVLVLDHLSRSAVNRVTYSWYRGLSREALARWAEEFQAGPGLARLHPRGFELLKRHADAGHRLVLVTGSLDLLVAPLVRILERRLGPLAAGIRLEAVRLEEREGVFTGAMTTAALGDEEKARRVRDVAVQEGIDLAASHAYGDSISDLPLLESVGKPAAVNPDPRLRRAARRRGWPVLDFRERDA